MLDAYGTLSGNLPITRKTMPLNISLREIKVRRMTEKKKRPTAFPRFLGRAVPEAYYKWVSLGYEFNNWLELKPSLRSCHLNPNGPD